MEKITPRDFYSDLFYFQGDPLRVTHMDKSWVHFRSYVKMYFAKLINGVEFSKQHYRCNHTFVGGHSKWVFPPHPLYRPSLLIEEGFLYNLSDPLHYEELKRSYPQGHYNTAPVSSAELWKMCKSKKISFKGTYKVYFLDGKIIRYTRNTQEPVNNYFYHVVNLNLPTAKEFLNLQSDEIYTSSPARFKQFNLKEQEHIKRRIALNVKLTLQGLL